MADKPILFSPGMVNALLAGTKTQTRRLPRFARYKGFTEFGPSDTKGYDWHLRDKSLRWHDLRHAELLRLLPYQVGDQLYVREAWRSFKELDAFPPRDLELGSGLEVAYVATSGESPRLYGKFRQGMHMPRWASRLTLLVTDVRVHRLKDIADKDAAAEGCVVGGASGHAWANRIDQRLGGPEWPTARAWYADLWDQLNAARGFGWDTDPWVAAYSFEVQRGNIDQLAARE